MIVNFNLDAKKIERVAGDFSYVTVQLVKNQCAKVLRFSVVYNGSPSLMRKVAADFFWNDYAAELIDFSDMTCCFDKVYSIYRYCAMREGRSYIKKRDSKNFFNFFQK